MTDRWIKMPGPGQMRGEGEWVEYLGTDAWVVDKMGKKAAGRLLDGRTWDEMPGVRHG